MPEEKSSNKLGKTLITGASGFIGRHLLRAMQRDNLSSRAHYRTQGMSDFLTPYTSDIATGPIEEAIKKEKLLDGISSVVHLASRVHQMHEKSTALFDQYRKTNRDLTIELARVSLAIPVKKFIFVSTVKAVGHPNDPYGVSKAEAERGLLALFSRQSTTQCIILRLPLVYGPDNKGNMLSLLHAASRGIPLPIGSATGKRSMIYVKNTCDAIIRVIKDDRTDRPTERTYIINDTIDLTSAELYSMIYRAFRGKKGVFPFPESLFRWGGNIGSMLERLFGLNLPLDQDVVSRLFDEYCFSSTPFCQDYQWQPPYTPEQGIHETVEWCRNNVHSSVP